MTIPVYDGMPSTDRTFDVPKAGPGTWGKIRCGGACKDDYARLALWDQPPVGGSPVKLQRAALDSFQAADKATHERTGHHIVLTGSWRSCAYQAELYSHDHQRYAPPAESAHCRGLAIDVSQALGAHVLAVIDDELGSRAWHKARPDSEPWHLSFGIRC